MEQDLEKGMDEVMEEIADDLGYKEKNEVPRRRLTSSEAKSRRNRWFLGGVGILLLILLIVVLSRGSKDLSKKELNSIKASLTQLDDRLRRLEKMETRISLLEKQGREIQQSVLESDRSGRALSSQLSRLSQEISQLKQKAPPAKKEVSPKLTERHYQVQPGDTLYGIAQKYGVSMDELLRANRLTSKGVIQPGQRLLIPPKAIP